MKSGLLMLLLLLFATVNDAFLFVDTRKATRMELLHSYWRPSGDMEMSPFNRATNKLTSPYPACDDISLPV
jgi:hypothetical protein